MGGALAYVVPKIEFQGAGGFCKTWHHAVWHKRESRKRVGGPPFVANRDSSIGCSG